MLHDSKFAPKIGIVLQNSSVPSGVSYLLAGFLGMVSVMGLVFGRWGKRLSGVRRVCRSRSWRGIAFENGWIMRDRLMESAERYGKSPYGQHLKGIADGEIMLVPNQKS